MFRVLSLLVVLGRGTPIRLTDVGSVAGRWAGFIDRQGGFRQGGFNEDACIELRLRDDGTYEATSPRTARLMDARGRVELNYGRLVIEGSHGASGTATLYSVEGQRTLFVEMAASRTRSVTARLQPTP